MAATTQPALFFMGFLALLATVGMFRDLGDEATRLVVTFFASIVWGFFGMSAFDVYVILDPAATQSQPMPMLAYLGIGLSVIIGLLGVRMFLQLARSEVGATDADSVMR